MIIITIEIWSQYHGLYYNVSTCSMYLLRVGKVEFGYSEAHKKACTDAQNQSYIESQND